MLAQAASSADDLGTSHLEAVQQWLEARALKAEGPIHSLDDEHEYLTWARLLIARNEPDHASQLLMRLLQAAENGGRKGRVIEIFTLQALAQQALGDTEQALTTIERALSLAEPEGYIRLFVDEGKPMAKLLSRMKPAGGRMKEYINKLLAAFEEKEIHPSFLAKQGVVPPPLIEPLSERELEVLRLIAAGLTNQEIAQKLFIAVTTAKKHASNIIGKLGVTNRTQAVTRARELELL
jgi:LuxR family maltose regulon positive regulatory protein